MIRCTLAPLTALMMLYAVPVPAGMSCGSRDVMVEKLVNQYNETQIGAGLGRDSSRLIEVWASCTTGTWTILKTYPSGKSCVMAVGDDWQGVGCKVGQPTRGD